MPPYRLQVDNLLEGVIQEVVTGDFQDEVFGSSKALFAHFRVPKGPHQEEVCCELPIHLVVPLQHDRFRVRRKQPVVGAGVELVCVSDLHTVAYLNFRAICPLIHLGLQLEVAVDSLIVEFFLLDLVACVLESEIHPVQGVQQLHGLDEQGIVDGSVDDVLSEDVLQLHDQFVHHLVRHHGHELDGRSVAL